MNRPCAVIIERNQASGGCKPDTLPHPKTNSGGSHPPLAERLICDRVRYSTRGLLFWLAVLLLSANAAAEPPDVLRREINQTFEERYGFKYERPEPEDKTIENVLRGTSMLVKAALLITFLTTAWRMKALQKSKQLSDVAHGQAPATNNANYSYPATAGWFIAGAIVTAPFSGSLAMLAQNAELGEVLFVGMLVPSFTWVVQLTASAIGLSSKLRRVYWGELGRVCLLGSVALLPAAIINLCFSQTPLWVSGVNVLTSVAIMGATLYRRTTRLGITPGWAISWVFTITVNMDLFMWASRRWW